MRRMRLLEVNDFFEVHGGVTAQGVVVGTTSLLIPALAGGLLATFGAPVAVVTAVPLVIGGAFFLAWSFVERPSTPVSSVQNLYWEQEFKRLRKKDSGYYQNGG